MATVDDGGSAPKPAPPAGALAALYDCRGRTGPRAYLLWGLGLGAIKLGLDRLITARYFGRDWEPFDYLAPGQPLGSLGGAGDRRMFLAMLCVALPFILTGVSLTVRRLRDAGWPVWLSALFFVPIVNVLFFGVLVLVPRAGAACPSALAEGDTGTDGVDPLNRKRAAEEGEGDEEIPRAVPMARVAVPLEYARSVETPLFPRLAASRAYPAGVGASLLLTTVLVSPLSVVAVLLATTVLRNYGWGLFVGMPFVVGMLAAVLHGMRVPRTVGQSIVAALCGTVGATAALVLMAVEGVGCLVMLMPLAMPVAILGSLAGHAIQSRPTGIRAAWRVAGWALVGLPGLIAAERYLGGSAGGAGSAAEFEVVTAVEVDAPPAAVWPHVVSFPDLPAPDEWVFQRAGVAYPVRARIDGAGVGAVRRCEFSTGAFVEPITTWDAPRRLAFDVAENPPPMREWSPWTGLHPPHLTGFLVAKAGRFDLIELPGGRTRLVGTTRYSHHMAPEAYWALWADAVIHRIHVRVLEHLKRTTEEDVRARRAGASAKAE